MKSMRGEYDPPFGERFSILSSSSGGRANNVKFLMVEECKLPLIDMNSPFTREHSICEAAREWGFFQLKNHGFRQQILDMILLEQKKLFYEPFYKKCQDNFMNLSPNAYRWGNPKATCLNQLSRSEAFHVPFSDISKIHHYDNLKSAVQAFGEKATTLAEELAEMLTRNSGIAPNFFKQSCSPSDSYVRMNRYPVCDSPVSSEMHGLIPHTDSDLLTILYQDQTGGLHLKKDGKWMSIRPDPEVVIVNIGDLMQAVTNDEYRSVEHRVIVPESGDRFSFSYFYCPSPDVVMESWKKPSVYRRFSFREYKQKISEDVEATGDKVGLSRFLI